MGRRTSPQVIRVVLIWLVFVLLASAGFVIVHDLRGGELSGSAIAEHVDADYTVMTESLPNYSAFNVSNGIVPGSSPPDASLPLSCDDASRAVQAADGFDAESSSAVVKISARSQSIRASSIRLLAANQQLPSLAYHLYCSEKPQLQWGSSTIEGASSDLSAPGGSVLVDLDRRTAELNNNVPLLVAPGETKTLGVNASMYRPGQAVSWVLILGLDVGLQHFDVTVDDGGHPFRTGNDGHSNRTNGVSDAYSKVEDGIPTIAGTAHTSAVWTYPPSPTSSRLTLENSVVGYAVTDSNAYQSVLRGADGQYSLRQVAWQKELLGSSLPDLTGSDGDCDEAQRTAHVDTIAGLGNQQYFIGLVGAGNMYLTDIKMRVLGYDRDNRPNERRTVLNCINSSAHGPEASVSSNNWLTATFSAESDNWSPGQSVDRPTLVSLDSGFLGVTIIAITVGNYATDPTRAGVASFDFEVDLRSSNGSDTALILTDGGYPFRQGGTTQYDTGRFATFCARPGMAPGWTVHDGARGADEGSAPCITPVSSIPLDPPN